MVKGIGGGKYKDWDWAQELQSLQAECTAGLTEGSTPSCPSTQAGRAAPENKQLPAAGAFQRSSQVFLMKKYNSNY